MYSRSSDKKSNELSVSTVEKIAKSLPPSEAKQLKESLISYRSSELDFCAPEMIEDKCWQAAFFALRAVIKAPTKQQADIWTRAQMERMALFHKFVNPICE